MVLYKLICEPQNTKKSQGQRFEGVDLKLPPRLTRSDPASQSLSVLKNELPANSFLLYILYFPKVFANWHCPFNMYLINTHFDMFFNNVACMVAHIVLCI